MNEAWLKAAKQGDLAAMKALADYLEEQGDKLGAATWRSKAGLSRLVYQVVNTETGKVEKEYKAMIHCEQWIGRYHHEEERHARKVRVMEFIERLIVEQNVALKPMEGFTGPVRIVGGVFAGQSGEAVGFARSSTANDWMFRVVIDGVPWDVPYRHLEFLG